MPHRKLCRIRSWTHIPRAPTSNFTGTEMQEENHCHTAKCITGYTLTPSAPWSWSIMFWVCVSLPWWLFLLFYFDLQLVSHSCTEKIFIQNKQSPVLIKKSNIISFSSFFSFPSLFYIKAVTDWALQKETQTSFELTFDCLLLHLISFHIHKG